MTVYAARLGSFFVVIFHERGSVFMNVGLIFVKEGLSEQFGNNL